MMKSKLVYLLIALLAGALLWTAAGLLAKSQDYMINGDFFTFWLGGRTVWTGNDPYDSQLWVAQHRQLGAEWIPNPTYVYPLPLALLYLPLGMLELPQAATLWTFLSILMIIVSVALLVRVWGGGWLPAYLLPALAGAFTFRPTLVTLMNGQPGALWLLACSGTVVLWQRQRWFAGGLLLALLALKPSFGLPLAGLCALWLLVSRHWSGLAGMAAGALALAMLGWLRDPGWVGRYLAIGSGKAAANFGWSPTLWGVANALSGCPAGRLCQPGPATLAAGLAASMALVVFLLAVFFYWKRQLGSERCMALCAASAVLATPYLWAYDQILLLLPVLAFMGCLYRRRRPYLLTAGLPLGMSVLSLALVGLALRLGHDVGSILLSLTGLGLAGLTLNKCCNPPRSSLEQALQ